MDATIFFFCVLFSNKSNSKKRFYCRALSEPCDRSASSFAVHGVHYIASDGAQRNHSDTSVRTQFAGLFALAKVDLAITTHVDGDSLKLYTATNERHSYQPLLGTKSRTQRATKSAFARTKSSRLDSDAKVQFYFCSSSCFVCIAFGSIAKKSSFGYILLAALHRTSPSASIRMVGVCVCERFCAGSMFINHFYRQLLIQ